MTEKEFLKSFIKYGDIVGVDPYEDVEPEDTEVTDDRIIDEFLEEHHKEYYEVEFIKKGQYEFDEDLGPNLILTDGEGKAIGELTEGVNTLYNQEGKVIGWSSLTPEQLRELYNKYTK